MIVRAGALSYGRGNDGAGWCSLPRGEGMMVRAGALSHGEREWLCELVLYAKQQ
jgi:hypothetical protein